MPAVRGIRPLAAPGAYARLPAYGAFVRGFVLPFGVVVPLIAIALRRQRRAATAAARR
ncbi:MAG TPA: hypothetical protein VHG93_03815 [Longimicrobium sp.]|nr:hypothetical protein [Longimicrobium sp.]